MSCAALAPAGRCSSRRSGLRRRIIRASNFPDAASWLVDEERRAAFEGESVQSSPRWSDDPANGQGRHFESRYHLTLLYMPPPDAQARAEHALLEPTGRATRRRRPDWRQELARFQGRDRAGCWICSVRLPAGDARARRCRDPDLSARDDFDEAPSGRRARNADVSGWRAGRHAADRRPGADAGRAAPADADHPRFPEPRPARHPRRAQPSGLRLSLGDALPRARQDRGRQNADPDPAPVVQQAQVDHRDAARGA